MTGNPGLVDYYVPFLLKLQTLIEPHFALLAHSHIGHSPTLPHPNIPLTLTEQIDAKVQLVESLSKELAEARRQEGLDARGIRIGFIGHSVGSEIIVQTMRQVDRKHARSEEQDDASCKVVASFLLFPTVAHIAETPNGRKLRPIFKPPLIDLLPFICSLIQPLIWTIRSLLSIIPSNLPGSRSIYAPNATTLTFLSSPSTVKNVLHLAKSEMSTIKAPDLDWFESERGRLWSYWGEPDGWVGTQGNDVKNVLRGVKGDRVEQDSKDSNRVVDCVDSIPHAFCLGEFDMLPRGTHPRSF